MIGDEERCKWFNDFLDAHPEYKLVWKWWMEVASIVEEFGFPSSSKYPGDIQLKEMIWDLN